MNPAPVVHLRGTVHTAAVRVVEPYAGREAEHDPQTGRLTRAAVPPREGYEVIDVVVLSEDGGYLTVVVRDVPKSWGGELPRRGSSVEWPLRAYTTWAGPEGRRFAVVGWALATEVFDGVLAGAGA